MSFYAFAVGLCVVVSVFGDEDCTPMVVDECGFKIYDTLMQPERVPVNQAELDEYCTSLEEGKQCVQDKLKTCEHIFPIAIANSYIESIGFSIDDICKSDKGKNLLEFTPCLKEKLSGFSCTKDFFNNVEAAILENQEDQMTAACCAFTKYDTCYSNEIKEKCGKTAVRSIRSILQGFGLFLIDKCLPILSDPEKCSQRTAKSLPAETRKVLSILPALTEIVGTSSV